MVDKGLIKVIQPYDWEDEDIFYDQVIIEPPPTSFCPVLPVVKQEMLNKLSAEGRGMTSPLVYQDLRLKIAKSVLLESLHTRELV